MQDSVFVTNNHRHAAPNAPALSAGSRLRVRDQFDSLASSTAADEGSSSGQPSAAAADLSSVLTPSASDMTPKTMPKPAGGIAGAAGVGRPSLPSEPGPSLPVQAGASKWSGPGRADAAVLDERTTSGGLEAARSTHSGLLHPAPGLSGGRGAAPAAPGTVHHSWSEAQLERGVPASAVALQRAAPTPREYGQSQSEQTGGA